MRDNRYTFSTGDRLKPANLLILLLGTSVVNTYAFDNPVNLLYQSEQRQAVIDEQLAPQSKTTAPLTITPKATLADDAAQTCFPIHTLSLSSLNRSSSALPFYRYVTRALTSTGLSYRKIDASRIKLFNKEKQTPCLSAVAVRNLSTTVQNNLIDGGWITSRVLIPDQTLKDGVLTLTLTVGVFNEIKVDDSQIEQTHADRLNQWSAFPMAQGEALNLRDLEQGLENLRRLPTVSAEMSIVPGTQPGSSDVELKWRQDTFPIRLSVSVDDSGSDTTGKYLGTIGVAWDNPLRLNDIFSASYTRNLSSGAKKTAPDGHVDKGGTSNYSIRYSVPLGYWSLDAGLSHYDYDQVVAGVNRNYHYTGDSDQADITLSRVLYRDDQHKLTAGVGTWKKRTRSYIDDAEIVVQRRRTGGWKASLSQLSYFKAGTLSSTLSYQRGTRAFGAIPAPEELFNEGTGKAKIWTLDLDWQMPFKMGSQTFDWHSQFHRQWNQTRLTPADKIAIGGRYSVRGFTGARTLSAERGWYLRNDIAWHYTDNHQVYLGIDAGHVSGPSTQYLLGQSLGGAVLGLKGRFKQKGHWYYDFFIGKPIHQPSGFRGDSVVSGFNLNYSL
ncbi:MAG: ShlB family hemolysin secretion/activation protein [Gammaproteobacteria bacterium]|nr:MAG: ShlB family hemolysin secretion/activation protein [Gammaproteobacteria bacterium]